MTYIHVFHREVYTKNSLIYGVGINDADYPVKPVAKLGEGKRNICPFYMKWKSMLERCYSAEYQAVQPTYKGCVVTDDWLRFSVFREWIIGTGYDGSKGFELDKDLIVPNNKIYSPETCVLLPMLVNRFLTNNAQRKKSGYMLGVSPKHGKLKFAAYCNNPFTKSGEYLGRFATEIEAHLAWKKRKHELACQLADLQTDERVANALRTRYL